MPSTTLVLQNNCIHCNKYQLFDFSLLERVVQSFDMPSDRCYGVLHMNLRKGQSIARSILFFNGLINSDSSILKDIEHDNQRLTVR